MYLLSKRSVEGTDVFYYVTWLFILLSMALHSPFKGSFKAAFQKA